MREIRFGHYFFRLGAVTFAVSSNCKEPLVAIELTEQWVRVGVLAEWRVCGGDEVACALAGRVKFTE